MNAMLSLLLLLFKASLLALGASLSPALDLRCRANTTISGAEEWKSITTVRDMWDYKEAGLYVHPDPGFKGVSLVAAGDGWVRDAWFTLNNTCFHQDEEWWGLSASVERERNVLVFHVLAGECRIECSTKGQFPGNPSLIVEAHGPSRWRFPDSGPCSATPYTPGEYVTKSCIKPLALKTTTTIKVKKAVTVVAVLVVTTVVGVVVVVVMMKKRIRQRGDASAEGPVVRHNTVLTPPSAATEVLPCGVSGEAADNDNPANPPRVARVLPRVPPRQEEPGYLYMGGWREDEEPGYLYMGGWREDEEPGYLYMGGWRENEEPIYEEVYAPAPGRQ